MPWTGESLRPAAEGSTRNRDGPSGARAGISSTLATWAHGTKRFVPDKVQPFDDFSARVAGRDRREPPLLLRVGTRGLDGGGGQDGRPVGPGIGGAAELLEQDRRL